MKSKKGFTLIELLAVIVILSIIALIATPIILNVIEDSRDKANINSTYGLIKAADMYYAKNSIDGNIHFDNEGNIELLNDLKVSGERPEEGFVIVNEEGNINVGVIYDKKCYIKGINETKVSKTDDLSKCTYKKTEYIKDTIKKDDNIITNENNLGTTDYRYYGPKVNNYISYNNETWRIIGLVNDKVKIISDDFKGRYEWDEGDDYEGENSTNDWGESTLREYLNNVYLDRLTDEAKSLIADVSYKYGSVPDSVRTAKEFYDKENDTDKVVQSDIGLMQASDYIYSVKTGDGFCNDSPWDYYDDDCGIDATWLYKGADEWLMTPSTNTDNVLYIDSYNAVYYTPSYDGAGWVPNMRPVLFLKDGLVISSGDGTKVSPYQVNFE